MKFRLTATSTLLAPGLAGRLYALPLPTCLVSRRHRMLFASCSEIESLSTKIVALTWAPPVFQAKILITELSFVRPNHRREKIHKFGHMHLDDFLERADRFRNELIICSHFSTRYHPQEVRRYVEGKLPPGLRERVKLWL